MSRFRITAVTLATLVAASMPVAAHAESQHRIGAGLHYWETLDDFADAGFAVEEDGLAAVVSYQYLPGGLFGLGIEVEYFPDGFGGATEEAFSPAAYVFVGRGIYGGLGVGVTVSDGLADDVSDPWWAARVGWGLELLPKVYLDLNANYRAGSFDELEEADVDTDSITIGAQVKVGF